ncbi:MAG TPA: hypothetical protein VFR55_10615 [Dehalococcoidia bacterium]|nr:hypothetical protein [Dehalococcoidia bacterium]
MLQTRQVALTVETEDPDRLGESRVLADGGPMAVAQQVDCERFFDLLTGLLGLEGQPRRESNQS